MAKDADVIGTIENGVLTMVVRGFPPAVIDPAEYSEDCRINALLRGYKDKYANATALGKNATLQEQYDAMMVLVEHHRDGGDWNRTRGDGTGTSGTNLLVPALMEYAGIDRATAVATVAQLDKSAQYAYRNSPELSPIVERLKAAQNRTPAATAIDVSANLAALKRS